MFVSLNKLTGLVIDLDSFPEEFDENWTQLNSSLATLFISGNENRLISLEDREQYFLTYTGSFNELSTRRKSLVDIHEMLGLESFETAVISRNLSVLKYIQSLNVSTIYFSDNSYSNYDEVGNLPDFLVDSISDINQIITEGLKGYFSEVFSNVYNRNQTEPESGLVIVTHQEYSGKRSTIVSGGRYFTTSDVRYPIHQLSQRIIRNKDNPESQVSLFSRIYCDLIRFIEEDIEPIDALTRIPPKPSQQNDRIIDCVNYVCSQRNHIKNATSFLRCTRDYESQKFLNTHQRFLNIQGVFHVEGSYEGKHIVILDDVISTGSTALEAAKKFYEAGARKVTILVLAVNQFKNTMITEYQSLKCTCGNELKMRFNRNNNSAFFGCTNFPVCKQRPLDFMNGVQTYNCLNSLNLDDDDLSELELFEF